MIKHDNYIGKKYGKLTVIGIGGYYKTSIKYLCQCECGTIKSVSRTALLSGRTKSCGCHNIEIIIKRNTKHNMRYSRIYEIWCGIKKRCNNNKSINHKNYGERGITYDSKWETFQGFYEDMGSTYKDGLTIERVNVNGNYTKDNCVWIPKSLQGNNTRRNVLITINEETHNATEWSKITGVS